MSDELTELRKPGRPCKYTKQTIDRLLSAVEAGLTMKQACTAADIGETTLNEWRQKYPDLEPRIEAARERARANALRAIQAAGERDWRAWEAWLRLSFQADYRQAGTKIDVAATVGAQQAKIEVVCDEAKRKAMIEAREKFLAEKPQPQQAKLQPGHIGRTIVPGEDKQSDTEQALVPGGATFTPFWEPAGVSEQDLYRR